MADYTDLDAARSVFSAAMKSIRHSPTVTLVPRVQELKSGNASWRIGRIVILSGVGRLSNPMFGKAHYVKLARGRRPARGGFKTRFPGGRQPDLEREAITQEHPRVDTAADAPEKHPSVSSEVDVDKPSTSHHD